MTLWFKRTPTPGFCTPPLNLDVEPCPTIMAGGIAGGNTSQYYLEDDGVANVRVYAERANGFTDEAPPPPAPGKPPFRVPSMVEIAALPWNGLRVASTFSGCGGSSLGYRMAGFSILYASEFVPAARDSYRANMDPATHLDDRDVRAVTPASLMKRAGVRRGELDLLDGSPPCASFSTAGKRSDGWNKVKKYSDTEQRTDDLFYEFVRLVDGVRPKTFVAENVSGLVKGVAKGYFIRILGALRACGYAVEARLLDAQWLGVPQARQRLIFVGVRDDLGLAPAFPRPLPYRYSVRDALPWISKVRWDSGGQHGSREFAVDREPMQTIQAGGGGSQLRYAVETRSPGRLTVGNPNHRKKPGSNFPRGANRSLDEPCLTVGATSIGSNSLGSHSLDGDIGRFAIGDEWDKLNPGEQSERFFSLVKPALGEPCPTVTGQGGGSSIASVVHPTEKRKFSIAELRRICAFPDDFVLTGTYAQQWERLGRAVPPVMMFHVASAVRDRVLAAAAR